MSDRAEHPRLGALIAAAARRSAGAGQHADRHEALQRHHRHAGEQAADALERVRVLRSEGEKEDVGPRVSTPAPLGPGEVRAYRL